MKKIGSLALVLLVVASAMLALGGCAEPPPINWWEDHDNITYIIEDERSAVKGYTFQRKTEPAGKTFEYVYNEEEVEEYIPKLKVMYKKEGGVEVEKEIYLHYYRKQQYSNVTNELGHTGTIDRKGKFYICWYLYQNKEAYLAPGWIEFKEINIYIIVK